MVNLEHERRITILLVYFLAVAGFVPVLDLLLAELIGKPLWIRGSGIIFCFYSLPAWLVSGLSLLSHKPIVHKVFGSVFISIPILAVGWLLWTLWYISTK
jgi:hypothetical protein